MIDNDAQTQARNMAWSQETPETVAPTVMTATEFWTGANTAVAPMVEVGPATEVFPTVLIAPQAARHHQWDWIVGLFFLMVVCLIMALTALNPARMNIGLVLFCGLPLLCMLFVAAFPVLNRRSRRRPETKDETLRRVYTERNDLARHQMSAQMSAVQPATLLPKWTTL